MDAGDFRASRVALAPDVGELPSATSAWPT